VSHNLVRTRLTCVSMVRELIISLEPHTALARSRVAKASARRCTKQRGEVEVLGGQIGHLTIYSYPARGVVRRNRPISAGASAAACSPHASSRV
jgi:hypothetical protein